MKALYALGAALLLSGLATAQSPYGRGLEISDSAGTIVGTSCQSLTTCAIPQITPVGVINVHVHGGIGKMFVVLASPGPVFCPPAMSILGQNLLSDPIVVQTGVLNLGTMTPCQGNATFQFPNAPGTVYLQALVGTSSGANAWSNRIRVR